MKFHRLVTKQRLKWLGVSVALGWAVATVVALSCAIWSDTPSRPLVEDYLGGQTQVYRGLGLVEVNTRRYKALDELRYMSHWDVKAGFPFVMYQRSVNRFESLGLYYMRPALSTPPTRLAEGVMLARDDRALRSVTRYEPIILPVVPIATGIVANTALYGGVLLGIGALVARFRCARKPGHCQTCGYDLAGLGGDGCVGEVDSETRPPLDPVDSENRRTWDMGVCPECGEAIKDGTPGSGE